MVFMTVEYAPLIRKKMTIPIAVYAITTDRTKNMITGMAIKVICSYHTVRLLIEEKVYHYRQTYLFSLSLPLTV